MANDLPADSDVGDRSTPRSSRRGYVRWKVRRGSLSLANFIDPQSAGVFIANMLEAWLTAGPALQLTEEAIDEHQDFLLEKQFHNRNNWLFSDTVAGANAAADLYSLVQTCKAKSIEPYHYLIALFKDLPHAHTADDYEPLLPGRLDPHGA